MTPTPDPDIPDVLGAAAAPRTDIEGSVRAPLSRRSILSAAIAMIDDHDLRYLTMRRLGTALGIEAMAIYHHVRGRKTTAGLPAMAGPRSASHCPVSPAGVPTDCHPPPRFGASVG
jgi:hypothetical protein